MGFREHLIESEIAGYSLDKISEEMSGADIASELGITRQAVSNTLKRAMVKIYDEMKKIEPKWSPFETAVALSQVLKIEGGPEEDLKKFFKLFPPKLRKEIEEDAKKRMPGKMRG